MIYYMIRHRSSGEYMPQLRGDRGYSHWNPDKSENKIGPRKLTGSPRLFHSLRKARKSIVQWNALPNARNTYDHDGEAGVDTKPDGRKKEDLEIVQVEITEQVIYQSIA